MKLILVYSIEYLIVVMLNFIPYDYLPRHWDYRNWNEDVQRINLAYRLQKDFEKWMTNFILKCDHKNIVLTGSGCALNCVANYEYLKHLPKDVNLYIEPVSNDEHIYRYLYHHEIHVLFSTMKKLILNCY